MIKRLLAILGLSVFALTSVVIAAPANKTATKTSSGQTQTVTTTKTVKTNKVGKKSLKKHHKMAIKKGVKSKKLSKGTAAGK